MNGNVSPKSAVTFLMNGAVPERKNEIAALWAQYPADVIIVADAKRVTLNADKDRIAFDLKTMDVFWLIGFAGWKAIECYSPLIAWSAASGHPIAALISVDAGLDDVERAYKERRAALQAFIETADVAQHPGRTIFPGPAPTATLWTTINIVSPTILPSLLRRSPSSMNFATSCLIATERATPIFAKKRWHATFGRANL